MDALNQVNQIRSSCKAERKHLPVQYLEYCLAMQCGTVMPWLVEDGGTAKVVMSAISSIEVEDGSGQSFNITLLSGDTVFRRVSGQGHDW